MVGEETIIANMLGAGSFSSWLLGAGIGLIVILSLAFYVYTALYLSTIAKKLKYKKFWLAWIPLVNYFLYPILAKKHWAWGFILLVPIVNIIFYFIWAWKIFELRKYPGWLCLITLISFIPGIGFIGNIGNLVIWGFVAWMDRK